MNKKLILFLSILAIGIAYIFNIDKVINNKLSILNKNISSAYLNTLISIELNIDKYFNQLDYIEQLKQSNKQNQQYKTLYDIKLNEFNELNKLVNLNYDTNHTLYKVKVLSYYKLNDYSKVIIDLKGKQINSISALLTYDGYSAGIILNKENQNIAYLNQNKKCNYAIFIGKEKTPGITSGVTKEGLLKILHIPLWKDVSIGDKIITSGMDSIFPFGIKVGEVVNIIKEADTIKILAKPYAKVTGERNFYLYTNSTINN